MLRALLPKIHAVARAFDRARRRGHEQHRLAQLAVARIELDVAARLGIDEDRVDHRLQVAAHALSVVVEDRRDARDVLRRRIAGDQLLDELPADEGPDIRVHEDVVDRIGEIRLHRLSRRQRRRR